MILDGILNELQSNNIVTREKAAVYINKVSRGNWTAANKDWLTDTRTISILIDAIEQETDEKILLELVNTIGNISQRYEYYNPKILNVLIPLYDSPSINIQVEACAKSIQFNNPRTWNAICKIFEKKTTKNTNLSLGLYIARYANNILKEFIDKLSNLIENAFLKEKNIDAKDNLLLALGKVGNKKTIGFINEQVIRKKTDSLLIERANQTIKDITERLK